MNMQKTFLYTIAMVTVFNLSAPAFSMDFKESNNLDCSLRQRPVAFHIAEEDSAYSSPRGCHIQTLSKYSLQQQRFVEDSGDSSTA